MIAVCDNLISIPIYMRFVEATWTHTHIGRSALFGNDTWQRLTAMPVRLMEWLPRLLPNNASGCAVSNTPSRHIGMHTQINLQQ